MLPTNAKIKLSKTTAKQPRKLKPPKRRGLHLRADKRFKNPVKLSSVWKLSTETARLFWVHKRIFIELALIYGLLNLVLVRGLASDTDISSLKDQLQSVFTGNWGTLGSGLTIFIVLLGSSGNGTSETAGAYQFFLLIIASLATIWALRQSLAGSVFRLRDAFYRGMYPLIPFVLVLLWIGLQLLPMALSVSVYSLVINNGIAVGFLEKAFWFTIALAGSFWSLYLISSSLIALYIVTLPDMTPLKAIRSAKQLVRLRRWTVLRKIALLPIVLLLVGAILMLPVILLVTPLTQWVFFLLSMFSLIAVHTYMYLLYRELLRE